MVTSACTPYRPVIYDWASLVLRHTAKPDGGYDQRLAY